MSIKVTTQAELDEALARFNRWLAKHDAEVVAFGSAEVVDERDE